MIEPNKPWVEFQDADEKLQFMKKVGLVGSDATYPKTVLYSGLFVDHPTMCELIGHIGMVSCVLVINGTLHCIDSDVLVEMQNGKTSAALPDEYVVLDFETTGYSKKDEIIEIAAVKFKGGNEIDSFNTLVNPQIPIPTKIQSITGIKPSDIAEAPLLKGVVFSLYSFLGNLPIVAHNAPFEKQFLSTAYSRFSLKTENLYIDTLKLSRKAFPRLQSYSLSYLKDSLNLSQKQSHRALPDVYNTQELLLLCRRRIAEGLTEKLDGNEKAESKSFLLKPEIKIHPDSVLRGRTIVFTGELSFSRKIASEFAEKAGARVASTVSQKTDFLVVGKQDLQIVGLDGISGKEAKAHQLIESGSRIQIIDETAFVSMLSTPECEQVQINPPPEYKSSSSELDAFDILSSILLPAMRDLGLDSHCFSLVALKSGSSVYLGEDDLFCRLRFRGGKSFVELPVRFLDLAKEYGKVETPIHKKTGTYDSKDYCKLICKKPDDLLKWKSVFFEALCQTIDDLPTDFGCCSRYVECSNAKKCVNPNKVLALQCYYLKNLRKGNILYGDNAIGHPIEFK